MTPQEKSAQLIRRFTHDFTMDFELSRQSAIMCVYEIIDLLTDWEMDSAYWQEVRMCLYQMNTGKHEAKADRFNHQDNN
jgi:hypothetical protein